MVVGFKRTCPNCFVDYVVVADVQKYDRWWLGREKIQEVFPELTPIQREQLQTGICSDKCWEEYLGTEEDE